MKPTVAVLQFPGVNCEDESLEALALAGLGGELFEASRPPAQLARFDGYLLPGGFSYQDRVRAGALAAKHPLSAALADQAERGKPVLGICNGAQVLVETGLVPGGGQVEVALARNRMPGRSGYYSRWVHVRVESSSCAFTRGIPNGTVLPLPIAHGEGRFTSREPGRLMALARAGQVPVRYGGPRGLLAKGFPENPNGADAAAAGVCNAKGNVLALMPHPERALHLGALSRGLGGAWGETRDRAMESGAPGAAYAAGPGRVFFEALRRHFEEA